MRITHTEKAEKLLLLGETLSTPMVARRLRIGKEVARATIQKLRDKYGEQVAREHHKNAAPTFRLKGLPPPSPPKEGNFPLPQDLWRGWINPANGIVPAWLGLGGTEK